MNLNQSMNSCTFMTPLAHEKLFDSGAVFPLSELKRRVLSVCWRDCCCPPYFSRAPAPVIERAGGGIDGLDRRAIRAWWLLDDGILEESDGAHSERLQPYFGRANDPGRLWPCYDFRILAEPFEVEMGFYRGLEDAQGIRTKLTVQSDNRVRVVTQEPWMMT